MFRIVIVTVALSSASFFSCPAFDCWQNPFGVPLCSQPQTVKCSTCGKEVALLESLIVWVGMLFLRGDQYVCKPCDEKEKAQEERRQREASKEKRD